MRHFSVFLIGLSVAFSNSALIADIVNGSAWINEIHYDNVGADSGERVEVVLPTGSNKNLFLLELYNGFNGQRYDTFAGSGWAFSTTVDNFDIYVVTTTGIQNDKDGLGLSFSDGSQLFQFLSYEGSFTATNGNFNAQESTNIGVSESGSTPVGHSLQLTGTGSNYNQFTWTSPSANTFGNSNTGQTLTSVPEPGTAGLLGLALVGFGLIRRRK